MVIIKVLVLIISFFLAILMIYYREKLVRMVGKNQLAERYLGSGGSYTFWILLAIFMVFFAATWLFM